jgi:hypothetical protein
MPPEQRAAHSKLAPHTHAICGCGGLNLSFNLSTYPGCAMMAHDRKLLHQPVLVVAREDVATLREEMSVQQACYGHYHVAVLS